MNSDRSCTAPFVTKVAEEVNSSSILISATQPELFIAADGAAFRKALRIIRLNRLRSQFLTGMPLQQCCKRSDLPELDNDHRSYPHDCFLNS